MTFKDAETISNVIQQMLYAEQPRARNRARINALFNGNPPYTAEEQQQNNIDSNFNSLEGTRVIAQARGMANNALLKPANYFNVRMDFGPTFKRQEWSDIITRRINKTMKRRKEYRTIRECQNASSILHGIGPVTWLRDLDWCPKARGIEDVLVPTRTLTTLENLDYFAIYTSFTAAELIRMTAGEHSDPGWNKPFIKTILQNLSQRTATGSGNSLFQNYMYWEKIEEDLKENSGLWGADITPAIRCYDFYFLDTETEEEPHWRRRIIIDPWSDTLVGVNDTRNEFLYNPGNRDYGTDISRLMHVLIADGAVVPPFRWHSVRSIGYLLYAVCLAQNRLRCKFNDAVFESTLWYFREVAEGDQERLEKVDLHHLGIIPQGLSWVPTQERPTINFQAFEMAMANNRQLIAESSASYVQDPDNGTNKEQTATEVMAKVNASSALVGSMLTEMYEQSTDQYREIWRRFCTIDHKDCIKFREDCIADGVDPIVFERWEDVDLIPERVLGAGNKTLEIAQADRLMQVRPLLPGPSQQTVLHMYVEANTDDPLLANVLVPIDDQQQVSNAVQVATLAWGTLIDGQEVALSPTLNRVEYVDTLMTMLAKEVGQINQMGGTPEMKRIQGLANVVLHLREIVQQIAQDPAAKEKVAEYVKTLGQVQNFITAYAQRAQEAAAENGQQVDPETQAKVQSMLLQAQTKAQINQGKAAQQAQQKQINFALEQQRKNAQTAAEIDRKDAMTAAEIRAQGHRTVADVAINALTAGADSAQTTE